MKKAIIISCVFVLLGGAFGNFLRFSRAQPSNRPNFDVIPLATDLYFGEEHRFADFQYEILKADISTLRVYRGPEGIPYSMFIAYFSSQEYGSQIHSPKHCLPGGGWTIQRHETVTIPVDGANSIVANRLLITESDRNQLMYYWFETRRGSLTSEFGLKIDLAINSLLLRPTDAAFVRITIPIEGHDMKTADQRAIRFIQQFYQPINRALPFAG